MYSVKDKKHLLNFFEAIEEDFLRRWAEKITIEKHNPYYPEVKQYGKLAFSLLKKALITDSIDKEALKQLASKIAHQRIRENSSISEFVYNVNIARSLLSSMIFDASDDKCDIQELMTMLNHHYDVFSCHAVSEFAKIKDTQLLEKSSYINETHKDRLTILGQLSSSFVHEFRNPLTSIIGFVKLLRKEHPSLKYLDIVDLELEQLKFRITQFLHTSRVDMVREKLVQDISINDLLKEILEFLYPSLVDVGIDVITDFPCPCDQVPNVNLDELKQVFLNILTNSIDALKETTRTKQIIVSCTRSQGYFRINISNNGPEIPSTAVDSIFEPFYTTKELGTGIGLHVCKEIVEKHSGNITCNSNCNLTTFTVSLPYNG